MHYWKTSLLVAVSIVMTTAAMGSSENSVQIRKQYGGLLNTPDHVMFTFLVRMMSDKYERDTEFAIEIVQNSMDLTPENAESFLQRMQNAVAQIAEGVDSFESERLCRETSSRSKADLYSSLNSVDDEVLKIGKQIYRDFMTNLTRVEKKNFKVWLDESKDGYSHTLLDHEHLYENRGIDVKIHLQQKCIKAEQKRIAENRP